MAVARWVFSAARWTEQDQVGAGLQPAVSGDERHDLRLGDGRHGIEVEAGEGFARRQARFGEMAFDAPLAAFGDLVFGQGGQKPRGWLGFLVGPLCEGGPELLDGRQAQVGEQKVQTRGVDRLGGVHAASPVGAHVSRAL